MSEFKVPFTTILKVENHPNADRLSIYTIYGFQVIGGKNQFEVGDEVVYCPIDAILPEWLEGRLFPEGSKIKLNKSRVRQIRIRGLASQGMIIPYQTVSSELFVPPQLETDLSTILGITKYEPPELKGTALTRPGGRKVKRRENPLFHQYNGLMNIKWAPTMFSPDELVVFQEKIHGTNARAALMPYAANTLWRKVLKFLRLTPEFEFCYGSNTVQLQNKPGHTGFYGEDVYGKVFAALKAEEKLKPNESIYGEIYGEGIQKGYDYGVKGQHKFILFDVKVRNDDGTYRWLNPDEVSLFAQDRGFDMVPEVYRGPYVSLDFAKQHSEGPSVLWPEEKVREGIVVKAFANYDEYGNKRALKVISEIYLDDHKNTDNH